MISGGKQRDFRSRKWKFRERRGPVRLFLGGFKWYWVEIVFDRPSMRRQQRGVQSAFRRAGMHEVEFMLVGGDHIYVKHYGSWPAPVRLEDISHGFQDFPPGWIRAAHVGATCRTPGCCPTPLDRRSTYLSGGTCTPFIYRYSASANLMSMSSPFEVPEAPWFRLDAYATEPEPVRGPGKWDEAKRLGRVTAPALRRTE